MSAKAAWVQGLLALVALVLAYATWQRRPPSDDEDVVVLDLTRTELTRVRYEDGAHWAEVEWPKSGQRGGPWVHYGQKPAPPVSSAVANAGAEDRQVRGNDAAERLLDNFAPLRAVRTLGVLSKEKRKELGLEGSDRRLEVVAQGKTYALTVSSGALGSPYLLDARDGKVYLAHAAPLMDLESAASRLVDRRLHRFRPVELEQARVEAAGQNRTFLLTTSELGQLVKVVDKSAPDKVDGFAKNWLEKAWRIYPTDVLAQGEVPKAGMPSPQVKIEYWAGGKSIGFTELARAGAEFYVRSENLPGWAKVYNVDELLRDAVRVARGS